MSEAYTVRNNAFLGQELGARIRSVRIVNDMFAQVFMRVMRAHQPSAIRTQRRNLSVFVGLACLVLAAALSPTLLESTIFPGGTIVGTPRRAPALEVIRAGLTVLGLYFVAQLRFMSGPAAFVGTVWAPTVAAQGPPSKVSAFRGSASRSDAPESGDVA
jgi:hypothetical protein